MQKNSGKLIKNPPAKKCAHLYNPPSPNTATGRYERIEPLTRARKGAFGTIRTRSLHGTRIIFYYVGGETRVDFFFFSNKETICSIVFILNVLNNMKKKLYIFPMIDNTSI